MFSDSLIEKYLQKLRKAYIMSQQDMSTQIFLHVLF